MIKKLGCAFCVIMLVVSLGLSACGKKDITEAATMDNLVTPFWQGNTVYDESVMLIAPTDANGYLTAMPSAKLLFNATQIISVKQYFNADIAGVQEFTQQKDFTYADGVITALGDFTTDLEGNRDGISGTIPYVTDKQVSGAKPFPSLAGSADIPSTDPGLFLPFTESYQIVQMQLSVTYTHADTWTKPAPASMLKSLPKTAAKLQNKQKLEMFVYGDSISTGANSSSVLNIPPQLATWDKLTAKNLGIKYGADVKLTNKSVGGWTTVNAISPTDTIGWVGGAQIQQPGIQKLLKESLPNYMPDLAIVGFGMNDATMGVSIQTYYTNINKIIAAIRDRNPECEILLLGTMLANPKAKNQSKNQLELFEYLQKIANQTAGVAAVNIGAMHQDIMASGKQFIEISSNNVNHPNDFMARVYAMNLITVLS